MKIYKKLFWLPRKHKPARTPEDIRKEIYNKFPCLLGRHKPAKKSLEVASNDIMNQRLIYCERCFKILYIGNFPPYHPNCRCSIQEFPE